MNLRGHDIGVCSWSLQPKNLAELAGFLKQLNLSHLQLALASLVNLDDSERERELAPLTAAGVTFTSGMIHFPGEDYSSIETIRRTGGFVPDAEWNTRKELAILAGKLAAKLGMRYVSTHIGFVPAAGGAGYSVIVDRIREIADAFAGEGIALLMETGQEPAEELKAFLQVLDAPNVGINFDPANMILYGAGDPLAAIEILAPFIAQVHVKDANPSPQPGVEWGDEVPFGHGQVGPARFLSAIHNMGYTGPLIIEREAGKQRLIDVQTAIDSIAHA